MPTPITIFPDVNDIRTCTTSQLTRDMIENPTEYPSKKAMPLIKLARFGDKRTPKGSLRHDANVIASTGLELDYDGKDGIWPNISEVIARVTEAGLTAFFYTSPSYTPTLRKWRLLLPYRQEITGSTEELKAHRLGAIAYMEDLLGVSFGGDTRSLSQTYYLGKNMAINNGSEYLGVALPGAQTLDQIPDLEQWIWRAEQQQGEALDEAATVAELLNGTNYHESLLSLAGKYVSAGLARDMVIAALEGAMDKAEKREDWQTRRDSIPRIVDWVLDKENAKPQQPERKKAPPADTPLGFAPVTYQELIRPLPPIEWLIDGLINPGGPIMISGLGSVGKSMLTMQLAFSLAEGWPLFGHQVSEPCTVFIINAEDSRMKFLRRAQSYMDELGITAESGNVHYWGRDAASYEVQLSNDDGVNEEWVAALQEKLRATPGRKVLILDPLSQFAQADENANDLMTQYRIATYKLVDEVDQGSLIDIHHEKKAYGFEDGAKTRQGGHSGRGASALYDRARQAFNLRYTSAEELAEYGMAADAMEPHARRRYVTLDHTKADEGEITAPLHLERGDGGILMVMSEPTAEVTLEYLIMEHGEDWLQFCRNVVAKIRIGSMPTMRDLGRSATQRALLMPGEDTSLELLEAWVEAGVTAQFFTAERGFKMGGQNVPDAN